MYSFTIQAEYSFVPADFRLKIFLFTFLDYRLLNFIRIADMSIMCLVLGFVVLLASFVRKWTEFAKLFKGKF